MIDRAEIVEWGTEQRRRSLDEMRDALDDLKTELDNYATELGEWKAALDAFQISLTEREAELGFAEDLTEPTLH